MWQAISHLLVRSFARITLSGKRGLLEVKFAGMWSNVLCLTTHTLKGEPAYFSVPLIFQIPIPISITKISDPPPTANTITNFTTKSILYQVIIRPRHAD